VVLDFSVITVANAAIGRKRLGVVWESDERLSDARVPLAHRHGALAELDAVSAEALENGCVTPEKMQSVGPQSLLANPGIGAAAPKSVAVAAPLQFVDGVLTVAPVQADFNALLTNGDSVLVADGSVLWQSV